MRASDYARPNVSEHDAHVPETLGFTEDQSFAGKRRMITPTPDITLDADLRNPGQFFACCGVLELASRVWPGSEGWFAVKGSRAAFHVATGSGHNDPLGQIVRNLCEPDELVVIAQDDAVEKLQADRQPVVLATFGLLLDWWLNSYGGRDKSELKVWAGQQTPAGNINALREAWREIPARAENEPGSLRLFSQLRPISGRFGFDPRLHGTHSMSDSLPMSKACRFRPRRRPKFWRRSALQRCRPAPIEDKRRRFSCRAWQTPLDIVVAPAVIVGSAQRAPLTSFPW